MRFKLPLLALAATGAIAATVATAAMAAQPSAVQNVAPSAAPASSDLRWTDDDRWDDDDDGRHWQRGARPALNSDALRRAGVVRIDEVERDDGRIEVEGYDARGREIEVYMDRSGQRVLHVDRDDDRWDDRDDRWDDRDDRWDD